MEKQKQTISKRLHCEDSCASDCAVLRSDLTRSLCDRNALQYSVPCLIKSSQVKSSQVKSSQVKSSQVLF